ncbi:MAG: LURP-one-related family protein [Planctomycetota bacterium]|nr:LURP-one-related family protein [Planctomycetota bacterium]
MLAYPIKMTFKILAIAPQIYVTDANGNPVFYVKQKLFKLKENVQVFRDDSQQQLLFTIQADRIIDWSAKYHIRTEAGGELGTVQRHGMKSLWKARYDITENGQVEFEVAEKSALTRFMDSMLGEVPVVGFLNGYFFNPTYLITHATGPKQGQLAMEIVKKPSLMERNFWLELRDPEVGEMDQAKIILSMLMIALLERMRG